MSERRTRLRSLVAPLALAAVAAGLGPATPADAVPHERGSSVAVTGFLLQGAPDRLVRRNADALAQVDVAGVSITASGRGVREPTAGAVRLLGTAHDQGLRAELLVSNYSNRTEDFDPRAAVRMLRDPAHVRRVATRLAGFVIDQGWDGVNVDLERVHAKDGPELVAFVRELQSRMPAERTVSIDISGATSVRAFRARGYRLKGLADAADLVAVMTYDQHGPGWSGPGPIGSLVWQRDVLDALLTKVPAAQVDLGVAGYGYTWPRHGTGHPVSPRVARRMVTRDGARAEFRKRAGEWTARLSNGTVLWWSDGRSFELRRALAARRGVPGLALWRLGSADRL